MKSSFFRIIVRYNTPVKITSSAVCELCYKLNILRQTLHNITLTCGTAVAQWLRCCATNRKFVGSIPGGVIRIFP